LFLNFFEIAVLHHLWRAALISCEKAAPGPTKFDFATRLGVRHARSPQRATCHKREIKELEKYEFCRSSNGGRSASQVLCKSDCSNCVCRASRSWLHVDGVVDVVDDVASDSRWNFWCRCRKDGVEDVGDVEDVVT
jgi:hypothetical protein